MLSLDSCSKKGDTWVLKDEISRCARNDNAGLWVLISRLPFLR
jgi:hypothetical protein